MLNCQVHYIIIDKLFLRFSKYVKYMFLNITGAVMISHILPIDILLRLQVSIEVSDRWNRFWADSKVLLNFQLYYIINCERFFFLSSVWSRCFWASQILWWFLTSCLWTFYYDCKSLLKSQVDGIDVWDDLNVVLNCQVYYIIIKKFSFCSASVWSRWFWASQIRWWLLTSSL